MEIPISFQPEQLFDIGALHVTNSLLVSWIVVILITILVIVSTRKLKMIPRGFQNLLEFTIEKLQNMVHGVTGDKKQTNKFFPLIATIFIYLIISNWMEILPGFGTIGLHHEGHDALIPIFRASTADLNLTIALAILVMLIVQITGIASVGFFKYAKKFINFKSPILFVVGLLELISEIAKIISFSFRLFGNLFAGEVLLIVITFLVPFIVPLPFLGLEIFVGFIQALVFSMLTLVFMKAATMAHA